VGDGEKKAFVGRIGRWQIGLKDGGGEGEEPFLARSWELIEGEWKERQVVGGQKAREELPLIEMVDGAKGEVFGFGGSEWRVVEKSGNLA
jgi:hypothetical protein